MAKGRSVQKVLFVVNPKSGGKDKSLLAGQIQTFCDEHELVHVIVETGKRATEKKIQEEIDEFKPDCVVAAGGDGTVNLVGKLLNNTKIALGIIPLGSSNAVAKNLKIPLTIPAALKTIHQFYTRDIDTLDINGNFCLHLCDLGFNANLIKRSHKSKLRGMMTYAYNLILELFTFRIFRYKLETPTENFNGKAFAITITNMQLYGNRAAINPVGKMDDGKFEICIFKPAPPLQLVYLFIQLYRHTIHKSKYSIFIRSKEATLVNEGKESVHIDGEPIHLTKKINIQIVPQSLKVIVPEE